ncbi:hypothetical protein AXF42_Ash003148 [Apostasia shenzhenica]|uniref:Protein RMD5 like A n=1 Tax=Apostasia shenzhenica TaxID=1088818 RepID=A0A2I0BFE7_9ASPA|nr:hypothetical protein AXF42_Ash003148 [Apostasia shenzhenica]
MELSTLKDAFDKVAKRQKLSSSTYQELVEQVGLEIEHALVKMEPADADTVPIDHKCILRELRNKLKEMAPLNHFEVSQKELNVGLSKCARSLEKNFTSDICKAYGNMNFDVHVVNQVIACHLYRQGLFDIGDCFVHEAHEPDTVTLKSPFLDMYRIFEAIKSRDLGPAIAWASVQSKRLLKNSSILELKLHQLQFVEILQKGDREEALKYARTYLAPFASLHKFEIQKLMACLLWAGKLEKSPYAEFMSPTHWDRIIDEVSQQFCSLLGQSHESPLNVVIAAGIQGLPTLLKLASVMAAKKQEWQVMKQLPVPVDLGREFQFHSVFVCPVLREQGSEENPPMLMPCGHVLSKQSIVKLSKSSTRAFKCPYCPLESTLPQCKQLYF